MDTRDTPEPDGDSDLYGLREAARAMTRLADTLDRVDRRSRSQTILMGLMAAVLVLSGVVAFSTRQVAATVEDCIHPGGQCYQESRTRTGEVQRAIVDAQHADLTRNLTVVCSIIAQHGDMQIPRECADVAGSLPTTTRQR